MEYHKRLFAGGDVTGDLDWGFLETKKIHTTREADLPMNMILPWAVDVILNEAKRRQTGTGI